MLLQLILLFAILWVAILTNVYSLLRLFFRFVLNTFFREVKIRGAHKIPAKGPVIFAVAPHANQFIDPIMLVISNNRSIGFLSAKKSMDKFWIGMFARALNAIPVTRPQDLAKPGPGTIWIDEKDPLIVHGIDTNFTLISPRSVLSLPKGIASSEVVKVLSNTSIQIKKPFTGDAAITALTSRDASGKVIGTNYKVIPHVDQSSMFSAVIARLHSGEAIGIFPEGGSHDRPEMLPLKPGVAMMALGAMEANPDLKVTIVPVGLNYFHADRFRSRAVVEYGDPIVVPKELLEMYCNGGQDKRNAVGFLLETIEIALKNLTLQAPDFETLMVIQAVRRLYAAEKKLDIDGDLELSRRFANAIIEHRDKPEVENLINEVKYYDQMLNYYGVKDYQVKNTSIKPFNAVLILIYRCFLVLYIFTLSSPMLILGLPLLIIARRVSKTKMKEAKAGSTVKIVGKDVVSTWKVFTSLVVIPVLWVTYTCLVYFLSLYFGCTSTRAYYYMAIFFVLYPFLGYATILAGDVGFDIAKSIPPLLVSLGNTISSSEPLRELRKKLKANIEKLVKDLGPTVFPEIRRRPSNKQVLSKLSRGETATTHFDEIEEWHALADQLAPQ